MAMTAKEHNRLAGIFLLVHGAIQICGLLLVGLIYGGLGAAVMINSQKEDEQIFGAFLLGVVVIVLIIGFIFAAIQMVSGWKMLKEKSNARTWGIVANIIAVLSFPLGTAVGIHGLWFLFGEQGKSFYLQNDMNRSFLQPPPNSWQQ
jgi:hypothetical protein